MQKISVFQPELGDSKGYQELVIVKKKKKKKKKKKIKFFFIYSQNKISY